MTSVTKSLDLKIAAPNKVNRDYNSDTFQVFRVISTKNTNFVP